jgi:NADH-quinone oxidoreductase subunit L
LNLFLFSMLLLAMGGNMLVLFVGWEGVGLCSYLLIGFWHKNIAFAAAGRKAFVVNRIGDAGFLLAMFLLFWHCQSLDFAVLANSMGGMTAGLATVIALFLFVGATGKSAQIPLFVWLPDAMAGPTPVSALIHAATMVTAGVYLLARMHFLFDLAPVAMAVVIVVAVLTAFIAAATALVQNDIKKVLAYSTVSQLGFMFMAAGAGAYWVAIFHVVTHAFFKACLFLGAGSVIHGCHHEQDMRKMGGLRVTMPFTCVTYLVSTIAIAGLAPFSGYYSKHAIVESLSHALSHPTVLEPWLGQFLMFLVGFTALLTAFYMTRSFVMTFMGEYRGEAHPHESPWTMVIPLVVLGLLAAFGGWMLMHVYSLEHYLGHVIPVGASHAHESMVSAIVHSWKAIVAVVLAFLLYTKYQDVPGKVYAASGALGRTLSSKFYFDEIYGFLIVRPLEGMARVLWKRVDQDMVDATVNGTSRVVAVSGEILRLTQTGQLRHYALFIYLATVTFVVGFLFY